jgi:heat shock protein HslJ
MARALSLSILAFVLGLLGSACGGQPSEPPDEAQQPSLTGPTWHLREMTQAGTSVEVSKDVSITLRVDAAGQVSGRSAVNRYFGKLLYTDAGELAIGSGGLGSTRMAGPPEHMELEKDYLETLARVRTVRRTEKTLTLSSPDGTYVLTFNAGE